MIALALAMQAAVYLPAFDTEQYCGAMGNHSQSYVIEQSCRQQEKAARNRILTKMVPARVADYCKRIAHIAGWGDSYTLYDGCVDQELDAASKL